MIKNKQKLSKKHTALLVLLIFSSLILCTCTGIGYFTSQKDDIAYISAIHSDIASLKANSTNGDYVKINKLIETGAFYAHKDGQNIYFLKPYSFSKAKLRKESNKTKSTFLYKDFINSKENIKMIMNFENIRKIKFMNETGLFSSFGNVFSHRLYPLVMKVCLNIFEFLDFDGFVMILLQDESIRICLCEENGTVTYLDYWFKKQKNMPQVEEIMKHILYRFKNAQ